MAIDSSTADIEEALRASKERRPVDPSVARRIEERAAIVIEEIRRKGVTDEAVPLVRAAREE